MLVSLYTVRVVLETLGAEDYGIYNVVAGVVTMFGFLSNSMAAASQRYFSFEIGRKNFEQLKKTFSMSLSIHILIVFIILLLAETIGLWFVNNKLAIPLVRMDAARLIYQFSIISFLFTILTAPYMAAIIAHEDMNIYAYVSMAEIVLKLGATLILQFISVDKLQLYGILICIVTFISTAIYRTICIIKYKECKFNLYWNKDLFKEITSYTGWNLFGAIADVSKNHIVNILLNQFFNPVVVAARSIASNINGAIVSFSQNFSVALRPQIIKSYASGQKAEMLSFMFYGSKGTYFLMYLFTLPIVLEMPLLLSLWLKSPPDYTVLFARLTLVEVLINSVSYPLMTAAQATGKNKLYQSIVGGISFLNLPLSWLILVMGFPPHAVMIVAICLACLAFVMRLIILKRLIDFSIIQFFREVILTISVVSALSAIIPVILFNILRSDFFRLCIVIVTSLFSICVCIYWIGLNSMERKIINKKILGIFHKRNVL
jgi:O-antigen/teichoic acid export membrane protein